jgi:hypothetical protein
MCSNKTAQPSAKLPKMKDSQSTNKLEIMVVYHFLASVTRKIEKKNKNNERKKHILQKPI